MLAIVFLVISLGTGAGVCWAADAFSSLQWLWILPVTALGSFLVLAALAFLFLYWLSWRVDQEIPQEKDDLFYRRTLDVYLESVLPILQIHIRKKGLEQIPKEGRYMLVCNHTSNADPVILMRCFRGHQLAFISKQENKDMFIVGKYMHKLLCQLINRENDREALKTILKCVDILKEDKAAVAVFPEGYINDDLLFHEFRSGVFKIAQRAKVPIVVCTLKDTAQVVPNIYKLKPSHVELTLLKVIQPEEFQGITTVELGLRIHDMMARDLGPDRIAK